jgi:glycerol-3-phosphate cytidylyltransferase-like family protein
MSSLSINPIVHERIEDCLACVRLANGEGLPVFESALNSLLSSAHVEIPPHLQGCVDRIHHIFEVHQITAQEELSRALRVHIGTKIREETLRLVLQDGSNLHFANEDLKNDRDIVLAATRKMGCDFVFAGDRIKNDPEAVLEVVTENKEGQGCGCSVEEASQAVRDNHDFAQRVVKVYGLALGYLSPRDQNDPAIVRDAIRENPAAFYRAGAEIRDNKAFVREALQEYHVDFGALGPNCRDDEEFVLPELRRRGESLSLASARLKDKKEAVLEAVNNDGEALRYASNRLSRDIDVVFAATRQNREAARWTGYNVWAINP